MPKIISDKCEFGNTYIHMLICLSFLQQTSGCRWLVERLSWIAELDLSNTTKNVQTHSILVMNLVTPKAATRH